jgi:hypothetical protein
LAREFPELISVRAIGSSWQGRDINVITLDARSHMDGAAPEAPKKPEEKKPQVNPPNPGNGTHTTISFKNQKPESIVQLSPIKAKKVTEMSEEELLEKNEDIQMAEKKKKQDL